MVRVLERLGATCDVPASQTCCGQPAFNSGSIREARAVGTQFLRAFRDAESIVAPSGSCTAMLRRHLPTLFASGSPEQKDATAIAARIFEFSEFIVRRMGLTDVGARFPHRVAYHDCCHLLRDLGIRDEPRALLRQVREIELAELPEADVCCGFGGAFSCKYPEVSVAMGRQKISNLVSSRAHYLVANDTGCLMHLRGVLGRDRVPVQAVHLAEVLSCATADV